MLSASIPNLHTTSTVTNAQTVLRIMFAATPQYLAHMMMIPLSTPLRLPLPLSS
jgi:hypothetical protein